MNKKTIITILLALAAMAGQAQTSFDLGEDCLNVIDVSYARGVVFLQTTCTKSSITSDSV